MQRPPPENCIRPEPGADQVGCALGGAALFDVGVEQIGGAIGTGGGAKIGQTDPDQAKRAGFAQRVQQHAGFAVDAVGGLGAILQLAGSADQGEIAAPQFQCDAAPGQSVGLGAVGHLLGQPPQMTVQNLAVGGVALERGFLRD